ncbi:hypothetical protein MPER_02929 [Moniliophthora perniciosa FA553]|nr:hypothetical protein MPER_02929 [Moniliophthora perniciosa FA553]
MEDGVDRALRFLEALVKLLPQAPYMRVFISSQPIPQWKDFLSSHCLSVDLDDYIGPEVQKDIHAYFESLQNDTYKKDEEVVATIPLIASQANGSFIYARTMFKLLEQSREDYLQSVNSAKEITGQDALSKVYSHLVDKALRSVATPSLRVQLYDAVLAMTCLRSALSLAEVCTLLDIGSKAGHLDRFLQEFSSVLHSGPDKQMHFVHNSFKDFLQERVSSPDTGPSTLARPSPHHMIASRLLRLMMEKSHRSSRDAISGALEYACLYWYII